MNIDRIQYFLAVAKEGTFSAAARKTFVSQTAISQQMDALEKELGTRLFERTATGVHLTEEGFKLIPYAEDLCSAYKRMLSAMQTQEPSSKRVTIAYSGPVEKALIENAFFVLHETHPEILLIPRYLPFSAVEACLDQGECDIALTIPGEVSDQHYRCQLIAEYDTMAAVSELSPFAERNILSLGELVRFPVIILQDNAMQNGAETGVRNWCHSLGFDDDHILTAPNLESQMLMVALNQGVSFFPAAPSVNQRGMKLIPVEDFQMSHQIIAAYRVQSAAIKTLVDTLKRFAYTLS